MKKGEGWLYPLPPEKTSDGVDWPTTMASM